VTEEDLRQDGDQASRIQKSETRWSETEARRATGSGATRLMTSVSTSIRRSWIRTVYSGSPGRRVINVTVLRIISDRAGNRPAGSDVLQRQEVREAFGGNQALNEVIFQQAGRAHSSQRS